MNVIPFLPLIEAKHAIVASSWGKYKKLNIEQKNSLAVESFKMKKIFLNQIILTLSIIIT